MANKARGKRKQEHNKAKFNIKISQVNNTKTRENKKKGKYLTTKYLNIYIYIKIIRVLIATWQHH
jgi:hypothetical protein